MTRIGELGTTIAATINRRSVRRCPGLSSPEASRGRFSKNRGSSCLCSKALRISNLKILTMLGRNTKFRNKLFLSCLNDLFIFLQLQINFFSTTPSSGMLRRVALVRTDVTHKTIAFIFKVTKIGELRTTLAVTSNRSTQRAIYC
jgi:hypothetical protein